MAFHVAPTWTLSLPPFLCSALKFPLLSRSRAWACPLPPTSPLSLCGKHLKKEKKQERSQVQQCGLNILFLGVVMASFWWWWCSHLGKFLHCTPVFWSGACGPVGVHFPLYSLSVQSVCVCNVPFWGVQNIKWIQNHFCFLIFNVMEWTKRIKKIQKPGLF